MPAIYQLMQVLQQLPGYFRGQQDLNQLQQEELPKFSKAVSDQARKQAEAGCDLLHTL